VIPTELIAAVKMSLDPPHAALEDMQADERESVVRALLDAAAGRAWLRRTPRLSAEVADMLLQYERDFRIRRRDVTLSLVVERANRSIVFKHASAIAAGPAAPALWKRLEGDSEALLSIALAVLGSDDSDAAAATLVHLVLDPVNAHGLTGEQRRRLAMAALSSPEASIRGMAAEFIVVHQPEALLASFDEHVRDPSEQIRGIVWSAAFRLARDDARSIAIEMLGRDDEDIDVRRSALIAIGTHLPTSDLVDVLSVLVVHPDEDLAGDAADLLYQRHRHPAVATAALHSPHGRVRRIAEYLLDPFRGSPAAGGSRPGDPTHRDAAEIFSTMIREIEERAARDSSGESR
jgi:hypothetical protein